MDALNNGHRKGPEVVKQLHERRQDEQGFTLIELMVVVLIMGILMAIAIPTFLSTQGSANDAGAKSNATNVFTGEKAYYEDNQVFIDAGKTFNGTALDANLPWGANGNTPAKGTVTAPVELAEGTAGAFTEVTAAAGTGFGQILVVEAYSKSGNCFYIMDDQTTLSAPIVGYAESSIACATPTLAVSVATVGTGNAGAHITATAPTATSWYSSW